MRPPIDSSRVFSFKMRVFIPTEYSWVLIGITDHSTIDLQNSHESSYAVGYDSNGKKWPERAIEMSGFNNGDMVETVVDQINKEIVWKVNGIEKATSSTPIEGTLFVPYIEMNGARESI